MFSGTIWLGIGVNTLMLASMYIMAALGFAFIFNMLGAINLAHGNIYMMGAYVAYFICDGFGLPNWLSILIAAVITSAFGLLLERFAIRPFKDDFSRIVMVGVALMFIFQTIAILSSGTKNLSIPLFAEGTLRAGALSVSYQKIIMFVVAVVILAIVLFITNKIIQHHAAGGYDGDYPVPAFGMFKTKCFIHAELAYAVLPVKGHYHRTHF